MAGPHHHRFFFVHVMKTSGSTFRSHLRDQFPGACFPEDVTDDPKPHLDNLLVDRLLGLPPEVHRRIRAYAGHFPAYLPAVLDPALVTLTILRDPIDRVISHVKHTKRVDPRYRDHAIEAIYEDPWMFPLFFRDHQAKVFALTADDAPESVMDVLDVDDARLAVARERLAGMDVLGFTDDHAGFLDECERRFGLRARASRGRWREATEDWVVTPALRRRIEADNRGDLELYEWARADAAARAG